MLTKLIRISSSTDGAVKYSLIILWPYTDDCDKTAEKREGNKSNRTNTLKQAKTKAMEVGVGNILNCLREIKTQNSLSILEKLLIFKSLWGLFTDIYRYLLQDSKHIFKYSH